MFQITLSSANWGVGTESRYRPGEAQAPAPKTNFLPHKSFLQITQANLSLIRNKLIELNEKLLQTGDKELCLNPEEMELLDGVIQGLEAKVGLTVISMTILIAMPTLVRIISSWDATQRLPILDLLRLATAASPSPTFYDYHGKTLIDILAAAGVFEKSQPNNAMLATRAFVNIFKSTKGQEYAEAHYARIFQLATSAAEGTSNKNLKVAVATLALKYAITSILSSKLLTCSSYAVLFNSKQSVDQAKSLLPYLINTLATESDSETLFRAMVAVGTLLSMEGEVKTVAVRTHLVRRAVDNAVGRVREPRIEQIGAEIAALI